MSTKTTLGILGLGTVGTGVVKLLRDNPQFEIRAIAVRDKNKPREVDLAGFHVTDNAFELADDPNIEIIVEVAGGIGQVHEVVKRAITNGKHIVTANSKALSVT